MTGVGQIPVAGVVQSILSWPALVPLSRLSYGAFLSHVVILLTQMMTNRERVAYTYMVKVSRHIFAMAVKPNQTNDVFPPLEGMM